MKKLLLIPLFFALTLSQNALAGVAVITVKLESIAIIDAAFGGHIAGNMEISVPNGLLLPSGVVCNKKYFTTRKTVDPDRAMFNLLRDAKNGLRTVQLNITDDPTRTAFPGRCSLLSAAVF